VVRVEHPTQHTVDHFKGESFQAIDCSGTDNQTTTTKRKYIKQKITLRQIKWPQLKHRNTFNNLNLKQVISKNCSYQRAFECAQ